MKRPLALLLAVVAVVGCASRDDAQPDPSPAPALTASSATVTAYRVHEGAPVGDGTVIDQLVVLARSTAYPLDRPGKPLGDEDRSACLAWLAAPPSVASHQAQLCSFSPAAALFVDERTDDRPINRAVVLICFRCDEALVIRDRRSVRRPLAGDRAALLALVQHAFPDLHPDASR